MNPETLTVCDAEPPGKPDFRRRMKTAWNGLTAGLGLRQPKTTPMQGFIADRSGQERRAPAAYNRGDAAPAEEDRRTENNFIATVSHELRTPLNAIIGFSEIIRNDVRSGAATPMHADFAQEIYDSGVHLMNLINQMLELASMENGRRTPAPEDVDLATLMTFCLRDMERKAEAAGVSLELHMPAPDARLTVDRFMLRQTVGHLLDNAVKFTPYGGAAAVSATTTATAAIITVRDTGVGIAPEDLEKAFRPFWQAAPAMSRDHDGAGLGLALAKKAVELMGGALQLSSEPGCGLTARIVLPLRPATNGGTVAGA